MRRWLVALALSAAVAFAATVAAMAIGCTATQSARVSVPVTIAATTFPASAPVYVAEQQGFFDDHGVDATVRVYESGSAAMDEALEGGADYATVAETPIVRAVVQGRPFSVIATIAQIDEANFIVTSRDRGIQGARDLKGKRVGVTPGTTGDFFLHIYLLVSQVKSSEVEVVEVPSQQIVGALLSGKVDAISTWPPYTTQAMDRLGGNAVVLDEPGLYRMSWNLITPAEPNLGPEVDERVLRALNDAEDYIREHPGEAQDLTSKKCDMAGNDLEAQWSNFRWRLQLDQSLVISFEDQARWMLRERGEPGRQPDFLEHIETGPLSAVEPGNVTLIEPGE